MLDTCFRIAIDPLFPPTDWNVAKKSNNGDLLTEIKMELVFDEVIEGKELKEVLHDNTIIEISDEEEEANEEEEEEEETPITDIESK